MNPHPTLSVKDLLVTACAVGAVLAAAPAANAAGPEPRPVDAHASAVRAALADLRGADATGVSTPAHADRAHAFAVRAALADLRADTTLVSPPAPARPAPAGSAPAAATASDPGRAQAVAERAALADRSESLASR
jgi:hypothetical protein